MFDVIVRNGTVLDGTGSPAYRADLGIAAGRIAAVERLAGAGAAVEIDATGRQVMPGFVDAHVHADAAAFEPATQLAALRQGVTTVVLGQDGISYAPAGPATLRFVSRYFAPVNGRHPGLDEGPVTVEDLLATYDLRVPLNTVYLLPHGTIRYEVVGPERRAADDGELRAMLRLVENGLEDGAAGLSSGLEYVPGAFADAAELAALCRPVAAAGLPYVTHMRGYRQRAVAAMAEVLEIAAAASVAAHVSHLHGPSAELIEIIDGARSAGTDLTFDLYPYLRGSSTLTLVTLPDWLPPHDLDRTLAALADPEVRARLDGEWSGGLWPRITLSHVPAGRWRWTEGLDLATAALEAGLPPAELCCEILVDTGLEAGCVFAHPDPAGEEPLRELLRHPAHMGGSDGIYQGGHPHPRGRGAFARLLGRHVRELGDWSWERAAVHLAGRPAARFGLADRGLLRPGLAADVVVLDPAAVTDRATYQRPGELAEGVDHVLVNGVPVLRDGALTDACATEPPGRALSPR
ncbi:N-acyl-D-amino-acid deacylase family protein [Spirillospora sp. CA-294931]|uniref:N-acyl-D-amino-acid deacylase family protein n=1 Tax=Spirillospora sp. CA-294931 TaxID=3240042 RepID=UPI003D8BB2FB